MTAVMVWWCGDVVVCSVVVVVLHVVVVVVVVEVLVVVPGWKWGVWGAITPTKYNLGNPRS